MRITLEATVPAKTKNLWRAIAVATVEGNGKNVPVQFRLGDSDYGQPVNTNWEGLAVKEVLLPEGQSTISAHLPDGTSQVIMVTTELSDATTSPAKPEGEKEKKSEETEKSSWVPYRGEPKQPLHPKGADMGNWRRRNPGLIIALLVAVLGILTLSWFGFLREAATQTSWSTVLLRLAILVGIGGALLLQGLRRIPADPPHVALVTFLGKRTTKIKKEGWRFFFFHPWLYGFIPINITKFNLDLKDAKALSIRTPDRAKSRVPVSATWTPDANDGENVQNFIDVGKEDGVNNILEDIIRERIREWGMSGNEGPQTWEEAIAAAEEATAVLLRAIVGKEEMPSLPSSVPTRILLKYYREPQRRPTPKEAEEWLECWERVRTRIEDDALSDRFLKELQEFQKETNSTVSYEEMLRSLVEKRRKEIAEARQGDGAYKIKTLGIVLNRLNVGEIEPLGRVADAADREAEEEQQRLAEARELKFRRERIKELKEMGYTLEQALEIVQTEGGKVTKTVSETKVTISPETREVLPSLASILLGLFGKGGK